MLILAISIPFTIASHYVGPIADKVEKKYIVILGFLIAVAGVSIMSFFSDVKSPGMLITALILFGLGTGTAFPCSASLGISTIPRNFVGVATGVLATVQEIGGTVGLSLVGSTLRTMEKSHLHQSLTKRGIELSKGMEDKVRSLLSNFEELKSYLTHLSDGTHQKILEAFRDSFMFGYRGGMLVLIIMGAIAILTISLLARKN